MIMHRRCASRKNLRCAGMLKGSRSMPDEATLADLPAQMACLQRKKALLLACEQPPPALGTLQSTLTAQPPTGASAV